MLYTMNPDGEINGYLEEVGSGPYAPVRYVELEKPIPTSESERRARADQGCEVSPEN